MSLATAIPVDTEKSNALDRVIGHLGDCSFAPDECWIWQGTVDQKGYGRIMRFGKSRHAHRMVWELLVGEVDPDLVIDHLCRERACVNPDHLEPVSSVENVLRGEGPTARNARKTHCPQGHPYDEANTTPIRTKNGGVGRACRACSRIRTRERRARARKTQEKNQ